MGADELSFEAGAARPEAGHLGGRTASANADANTNANANAKASDGLQAADGGRWREANGDADGSYRLLPALTGGGFALPTRPTRPTRPPP